MYLKPQVVFKIKTLEDTINIFTDFFSEDDNLNGRMCTNISLNYNINVEELRGKSIIKRKEIISEIISPIYETKLNEMKQKVVDFQNFWNENANTICREFEKIFKVSFNGVRYFSAEINLNSVCPRFLNADSFDVYYRSNKQDILQTCIHELIHFYWFQLWVEEFPKSNPKTFEHPYAEWLLSEIAVDPIIYYSELRNFSSDKPAYKYFYSSQINGENLIEFFRRLFKSNNLVNFMSKGLETLNNNPDLVANLVK